MNQAGFCKGAMTIDHILSLYTIIEKHKKTKTAVFGAFIDYKKAFDSVWRDGLMLKLARMGIEASLFRTIKDYYFNRKAIVKIGTTHSDPFATRTGVIQGEPPSPELFKIFVHELSLLLNEVSVHIPSLNGKNISHLLWADDLFLNALSPEGLQNLLNILYEFCLDWGLYSKPGKV